MSWLQLHDGVFPRSTGSRLQARPVHTLDAPDGIRYRGGQVWRVDGSAVTIRTLAESSRVRDYVVDLGLFAGTDAAPNAGDAVIVTVTGTNPDDFVVTSVRAGRPTFPGDAKRSVERDGLFSPGLLNGRVPGAFLYQDKRE